LDQVVCVFEEIALGKLDGQFREDVRVGCELEFDHVVDVGGDEQ
jgi:hypothetical protein